MVSMCIQMKTIEIISESDDEDPIVVSESDEDSIVEHCTKDFEAVEATSTSEVANGNCELLSFLRSYLYVFLCFLSLHYDLSTFLLVCFPLWFLFCFSLLELSVF